MAYITAETSKKIRAALKAEFGKLVKFSVTISNHSSLNVTILESPFFDDGEYIQVNHYWIGEHYQGAQLDALEKIVNVIKTVGKHYDNSDSMTDYFDVAFYFNINIGRWNKKHINTKKDLTA